MSRSRRERLRLYAERDGEPAPSPPVLPPEPGRPCKTHRVLYADGTHFAWLVRCPVCDGPHSFDERWTFDGNHERPTFSPSMLVRGGPPYARTICHSFLTAGVWHYLADCTHAMRGRDVPAPDWPTDAARP